jgi:hypothetical protein
VGIFTKITGAIAYKEWNSQGIPVYEVMGWRSINRKTQINMFETVNSYVSKSPAACRNHSCTWWNHSRECRYHIRASQNHNKYGSYTLRVEIILERVFITLVSVNFTCQNYSRVCGNYTLCVKLYSRVLLSHSLLS